MAKRRAYTKQAVNEFAKQLTTRLEDEKGDLLRRVDKGVGIIMKLADQYVPEDTQATKFTAYTIPAKFDKGRVITEFGYDPNEEIDYIELIYYNRLLGLDFKWTKTGASDQWLDRAFEESKDEVYTLIGKSQKRGKK